MKTFIIALKLFLVLTVITGVIYPLVVTMFAQMIFPSKANGSLVVRDNRIIGSELIGQQFDSAIYFTPRPSAVSYNPLPSGGSNYPVNSKKLVEQVCLRKAQFISMNHLDSNVIVPAEMLFASGSGLDPHISPESALMQVDRIAKARNFNPNQKQQLLQCVNDFTEAPQFLILGDKRVNVFLLNLATDNIR